MEELLEQIERSCEHGDFYLALFAILALPDICAAIESPDGRAEGRRYRAWFDNYVTPNYDSYFDGKRCYAFRCSTLHQGRADHKDLGYERIVFVAPEKSSVYHLHGNVMNGALNIDLLKFCSDVIAGVRKWIEVKKDDAHYKSNMASFLKRYPNGLVPYVSGCDVYA